MHLFVRAAAISALMCAAPPARAEERAPRQLSLEQALQELDSKSLTLQQARSRVDEAAGIARQSLAALLPTLSVAGSYTRNNAEAKASFSNILGPLLPPTVPQAALPSDLVIQPLQVWSASGLLRVPIAVPTAWADLYASLHVEAAARASTEAVRLQLRTALVQAAWTASASEEIVNASRRALNVAQEQALSAARAVEAGTGTPLAVLQAQTEAVKRESDLARALADEARAYLALGVLLGGTDRVRIAMSEPQPPAALDEQALADEGLSGRPELRAQKEQVEAAHKQVQSAWLRLAPQLSASASAFKQDAPFPTGLNYGWRATVDLTWTLYDGGFRYGKQAQAEAMLRGAKAAQEQQRIEVVQQVADAVRDIGVAQERLRLAQKQRRLAADAAAIARRSFSAGIASSLDVLDANDRLYQSEVAQADAQARLGVALAALDRARGAAAR